METKTFKVLTAISSYQSGSDGWGTVKDTNTVFMFGSIENVDITGEYVYVYERMDSRLEKEVAPDIKVTISDDWGSDLCVLLYKIG